MIRHCYKCGVELVSGENWAPDRQKHGSCICRACDAARKRAYREKNKEKIAAREKQYREENREKIAARVKRRYEKNKEYVHDILAKFGCQDCGCEDVRVLDFHHRNPNEKELYKTQMLNRSRKNIDEEVAKCDILCANCHRIVHWEMRKRKEKQ